jgi:DNA-binding XRE family transcriptional regulator
MSTAARCKSRRESVGIDPNDLARSLGVSVASIYDLESYESELRTVHSIRWSKAFAKELGTSLCELLGLSQLPDAKPVTQLAMAIRGHCSAAQTTLDEFSDSCGWDLAQLVQDPSRTDELLTFDALADVCAQLGCKPEEYLGGDGARA